MKTLLFCLAFAGSLGLNGQTLTGTWQVTKETTCKDLEIGELSETEKELQAPMNSMSSPTGKIMKFNDDNTGEQNWKLLGEKKPANREKFLFKTDGEFLYILDKKSKLIADTYIIISLTSSSLVLERKERSCEQLTLVRTDI